MSISAWAGNGSIKMTRVEFNTRDAYGNNGMRIHLAATATGFRGHRIQFIAFFYKADGLKVYGGVPNYKAVDNHSCSYIEDNALYDGTTWNDNTLFVPYSILTHSAGVNNYKYQLELRDASNRNADIAKSEFYSFQVTFGNSSSSNNNNYSNNNSYRSNNNQPLDPIHPMQGDTYFEYEQNGLKVKTWTHPDESVTMQMSMPCYSCATFVKGRCMNCRGTGNGYYLFPGRYFPCPACGGTSICGTCKGTVWLKMYCVGILRDQPKRIRECRDKDKAVQTMVAGHQGLPVRSAMAGDMRHRVTHTLRVRHLVQCHHCTTTQVQDVLYVALLPITIIIHVVSVGGMV